MHLAPTLHAGKRSSTVSPSPATEAVDSGAEADDEYEREEKDEDEREDGDRNRGEETVGVTLGWRLHLDSITLHTHACLIYM